MKVDTPDSHDGIECEILSHGVAVVTIDGISFAFDSYDINGDTYDFAYKNVIHVKVNEIHITPKLDNFLREHFDRNRNLQE